MTLTTNACMDKCREWRKYLALLGGIFVYLPIGMPWYFGNLATYIDSYFYARVESENDLLNPQWIFSAFLITFTLAVPGSGILVQWIGVRFTLLVALVIHSGATFFSYFAIQHSMPLLVLVFGAAGGLGAGLAYGPPLPVVVKWMPDHVGTASGVLLMGFGGGSIFYNELITDYVNPHYLNPNVRGKMTTYFSQEEVLTRLPDLFLVLGSLTVVLQAIGVLLLRAPNEDDEIDSTEPMEINPIRRRSSVAVLTHSCSIEIQQGSSDGSHGSHGSHHERHSYLQHHAQHEQQQMQLKQLQKQRQQQGQEQQDRKETGDFDKSGVASYQSIADMKVDKSIFSTVTYDVTPDCSPKQLLTSVHFYILWTCLAANHYGYIIKSNYYKAFGQSRISDDHFLTMTGTLSTVAVALARLFWGWLADRFGVKTTLILFMASTTISTGFWYPSISQGHIVYMVVVIVIAFVLSGAFIIFPLAALKMFGETHYPINYGLILSAQIVINLISPPINRAIMLHASWFWMFCSIAIVNALGMVLSLFLKDYR